MTQAASLHSVLDANGIPVDTVRYYAGTQTVSVAYSAEATEQQRAAGDTIVAGFDLSDTAEQARQDALQPERATIRDLAASAVQANNTFLALTNPSNAQVIAQVRRLTQQSSAVIRRLVQLSER